MPASDITGPKGELKEFGFKPGVGMIYVDERGKKFVKNTFVRRGRTREQNISEAGMGRPHMSKKERLKLKKQYEEYARQQRESRNEVQ